MNAQAIPTDLNTASDDRITLASIIMRLEACNRMLARSEEKGDPESYIEFRTKAREQVREELRQFIDKLGI